MTQPCPYCDRAQPSRSAAGYGENPFCRWCLHERMWRASGVAQHVDQAVIEKLRELRHLMEHATELDRHKLPEMSQWFETYLARASHAQRVELTQAVRRLWPVGAMVLIKETESEDQEIAAGARLALERMQAESLRDGGKN